MYTSIGKLICDLSKRRLSAIQGVSFSTVNKSLKCYMRPIIAA